MTMRPHCCPRPLLLDAAWEPCAVGAVRRSPLDTRHPVLALRGTPTPTRAEVTILHAREDRAWVRRATHHHTRARAPRRTATSAAQALMPWSWRSCRGWRRR